MTTMRDILARAIRMTRARALGETPSAEESEAALEDAQGFFLTYPVRKLTDVEIDANYTAKENERVTFLSGSPTVAYPTEITESDGTVRLPTNGALVEVSAAAGSTRKIYIAELKTWMALTGLTLDSEQPFGPTHDLDVAAMIAARISGPVLQRDAPADTVALAGQGRANTRNAFRQVVTLTLDRALLNPCNLPRVTNN